MPCVSTHAFALADPSVYLLLRGPLVASSRKAARTVLTTKKRISAHTEKKKSRGSWIQAWLDPGVLGHHQDSVFLHFSSPKLGYLLCVFPFLSNPHRQPKVSPAGDPWERVWNLFLAVVLLEGTGGGRLFSRSCMSLGEGCPQGCPLFGISGLASMWTEP